MSATIFGVGTTRHKKARLGKTIGKTGYYIMLAAATLFGLTALLMLLNSDNNLAALIFSPAILFFMVATWWKHDLSILPIAGDSISDRLSFDILANLPNKEIDSQELFKAIQNNWQSYFLLNHLYIPDEIVEKGLSENSTSVEEIMKLADSYAKEAGDQSIEAGYVMYAILKSSPVVKQTLKQSGGQEKDIEICAQWLSRIIIARNQAKLSYGGVGRDWANGFTPLLNRFGLNVSLAIMKNGSSFDWLTKSSGVKALEAAFDNSTSSIAIVGPDGIGKSSNVYALAQKLIEGKTTDKLAYHQVISLSAIDITSFAKEQGELEDIMVRLISEASHAGHIILFFDNAQLFFDDKPGAFDATQILTPIIQSSPVPMIFAFTDTDYQRLRTRSQSLANLLNPVILQELDEAGVIHVLEDTALGLEAQHKTLITYRALIETYRLSGRYNQDQAYPGKAIKLLEESLSHAQDSVITPLSVQQAVEQASGVKVSKAAPQETSALLNMEDAIHSRMINQSHAVKVVANALRRSRAGVTNPNRPIGSFLFLGPTGVGKTELAKSVAAIYYGDEASIIRIDMSEYQQPEDVQRLLATGENEASSLLMKIRSQPSAVVLLDEIEKAHPNILNLMLQLLDEGMLTDASGKPASFKDSIIITTSNAGAQAIREHIEKGENLDDFATQFTDDLINSGEFKPELLNRFDEIVLFRPLNKDELKQVVGLMIKEVNKTLANQNITVALTDAATAAIVEQGNDPRLGARPMRRAIQRAVENSVAQKILSQEVKEGDSVTLDVNDLSTE